jgi:signal transduction histidine kinase
LKLKERFKCISIKWRIFGYFAFFTAVILILLWVFQVLLLDDFYKAIKIREIKTSTQTIIKNIDSPDFAEKLQNVAQDTQLCAIVSSENGTVINVQNAWLNNIVSTAPYDLARDYMITEAQGGVYFQRYSRGDMQLAQSRQIKLPYREGIETIIYAKTAVTADGTKVLVLLTSAISPVDATVNTLRVQLLCITVVMLVLGLLLALFLSKRISKPIIQINSSAKLLGTGNYNVTFEQSGYSEISELGQTLNYAAKELSKTEALRRDLIANISHDLRTPLTMITGYSEVMRDLPGENTPENVQIIIDEATRLTTLVNDVLDISKLQSGTQPMNKSNFNLTDSIREILQRYTKLTDYNITFKAAEDVTVNADELKISQVVYNLVNNAITYTGADKRVEITQLVSGGKVKISVRDTGDGIPQDKLNDIWNRYYKVDKSHKRAQIGTGLGLSIVKSILDMHGGAYGVQSQEGAGSIFWFELSIL